MPHVKVAVINASEQLDDSEVAAGVSVLVRQLEDHFAPAWGVTAELRLVGAADLKSKLPGYWGLTLLPTQNPAPGSPAAAVVGGYHDLTAEGLPLAKVFIGDAVAAGAEWTEAASHELLEMLADPRLEVSHARHEGALRFYVQEVCDPCQRTGYAIDGRKVSNFAYPAWFGTVPAGDRFDHSGSTGGPFELARDGSIIYYDTARRDWRMSRCDASGHVHDEAAPAGRIDRRGRPASAWRASDQIWSP